ncbi:MAG TPA: phosphatidylserine decarboxylase family protein [Gemmatimonadales bacterium]|nr:phosphatidylserine decarboxylase family protein [Gemmatimonadales bacterium]
MRIAPEGWPFIGIGAALVAIVAVLRWAWPGWVTTLALTLCALLLVWLFVFFRDPNRSGPRGDNLVISPADGRIVSVAEVDEPMYLHTRARRISVFMNVLNVHVNRYPVSGEIEVVHYNPGEFFHAADDKASLANEQASVGIRSPIGPVLVRQIAGLIARRIVTDGQPGDTAVQGERMGMIRFGSRVDVFVDPRAQVRVAVGDRVAAGVTVLAEVVR